MKITILTLFPDMFKGPFDTSIIKRSLDKNLADINYLNIRDFGLGSHKTVDDTPYGGGKGMILRVDVLSKAISKAKQNIKDEKVVLLAPTGTKFNQGKAKEFSKLKHLILICGHYEGVDARIDSLVDEKISVGDFVVTGGELPAMIIVDSVIRLLTGSLKEGVTEDESFAPLLEYPQYTKPQSFNGQEVPDVLLSGNHKEILDWRRNEAIKLTRKIRPDLLKKAK